MESMNLIVAWIGIAVGMLSGAVMGLDFQRESWLEGYSSWSRRLIRLGHISFFGLAFINLSYALSVRTLGIENDLWLTSVLLIIGAITMPLICFLAAWKKQLCHLFPIPVLSLLTGVVLFTIKIVLS